MKLYTDKKFETYIRATGEKIIWENCKIKSIAGIKPYKRVEKISHNKVTIGHYVIIDSHMTIVTVVQDALHPTDASINTQVIFDLESIRKKMFGLVTEYKFIHQSKKQEKRLGDLAALFCDLDTDDEIIILEEE